MNNQQLATKLREHAEYAEIDGAYQLRDSLLAAADIVEKSEKLENDLILHKILSSPEAMDLKRERDTLQAKVKELEASLPLSTNRTREQARQMLGEVSRHVWNSLDGSSSHGCVEVTTAISVVDTLIAEAEKLKQDKFTWEHAAIKHCNERDALAAENAELKETAKELGVAAALAIKQRDAARAALASTAQEEK